MKIYHCLNRIAPLLKCLVVATVISVVATSRANAQHSDVLVANVGGQVAVGAASNIDAPGESLDLATNVFEAIVIDGFAPPTPADYETDIGFFALHAANDGSDLAALGAAALPSGASVTANAPSFTVNGGTDALFYWDGIGGVDFQPVSLVQPGVTFAFSPPSFGTTGGSGELDDHPIFQLNRTGAGAPADGVYLIAPTIDVTGLAPSENFYVVLLADALIGNEDDAELVEAALESLEEGLTTDAIVDFGGGVTKNFAFYEEGVEWVEQNLAVPEPSGLGLATIIGLALAVRRRR